VKSVKISGGAAGKGLAAGLAGALGVLLVIKVAWWVLAPLHPLVLVYIVAHAAVKLYATAANARAKVLSKEIEARRGRRGRG
jgi:phosphate/sulfate permease